MNVNTYIDSTFQVIIIIVLLTHPSFCLILPCQEFLEGRQGKASLGSCQWYSAQAEDGLDYGTWMRVVCKHGKQGHVGRLEYGVRVD